MDELIDALEVLNHMRRNLDRTIAAVQNGRGAPIYPWMMDLLIFIQDQREKEHIPR